MADTKVSALTAGSTPTGVEKIPAVQSSSSVSLTVDQVSMLGAHPGYVATRWYTPPCFPANGTAHAADTVKVVPLVIPQRITISDLGCRITTVAASGHLRLGIYASDATTKRPTGTALSSCVVATDVAGFFSATLGANVSLNAGVYWFAAQSDNSTVVCNGVSSSSPINEFASLIGDASSGNVTTASLTFGTGYSVSGAYASGLPDMTSASFTSITTTNTVFPFFKVTSVP